jgi:hypothetical protein
MFDFFKKLLSSKTENKEKDLNLDKIDGDKLKKSESLENLIKNLEKIESNFGFGSPDKRTIDYALSLKDFYFGEDFIGDREVRLDVIKWMCKFYFTEGNPIGNDGKSIKEFLNRYGKYLINPTKERAQEIIDTTYNFLKNAARLRNFYRSGVDKFSWNVCGDHLTCQLCNTLDGRLFEIHKAIKILEKIENDPPYLYSLIQAYHNLKVDDVKITPTKDLLINFPPAHFCCRCVITAYIDFIQEDKILPIKIESLAKPVSEKQKYLYDRLEMELKALSQEEISNRIKRYLASDWIRVFFGEVDLNKKHVKAQFEEYGKALRIKSVEEYIKKSREIIKNPEHVYIQKRFFNNNNKEIILTDFVFTKGKRIVISNDDFLGILSFKQVKGNLEDYFIEQMNNEDIVIFKLI